MAVLGCHSPCVYYRSPPFATSPSVYRLCSSSVTAPEWIPLRKNMACGPDIFYFLEQNCNTSPLPHQHEFTPYAQSHVPGRTVPPQPHCSFPPTAVKLLDFRLATGNNESADMDFGYCALAYKPYPAYIWPLGVVPINMLHHVNPQFNTLKGACPSS
ncbi:unnamed protein product [Rhizoctonia solani]|uniref:Uncharacterized protein n=1 Tax=Rhizoctonia solani TaxID=456999 RepID=A0A8H3E5D8_9AGAM|nr:unnamed protein product [Rhizoctonia solani]